MKSKLLVGAPNIDSARSRRKPRPTGGLMDSVSACMRRARLAVVRPWIEVAQDREPMDYRGSGQASAFAITVSAIAILAITVFAIAILAVTVLATSLGSVSGQGYG